MLLFSLCLRTFIFLLIFFLLVFEARTSSETLTKVSMILDLFFISDGVKQ